MSTPAPFSLLDPLPTGTTLLEASAGTGKTHTIAALVARYVAEGHCRLPEMLVITFSRAASEELRERVRDTLREVELALLDPASPPRGELLTHLLDCSEEERALRLERISAAMADFDSATIATTHTFCQMVLRSLGVAGDTDRTATLVEDLDELTDEVIADLYLADYAGQAVPELTYAEARELGRTAIRDPQAEIYISTDSPQARARAAFAKSCRDEIAVRKQRLGILSFDDLLEQLAAALKPADSAARIRMRKRWSVVLVDEFQDTDPVQWQVLERAFVGHSTLVLIGDPKQAIYAFRGGDIFTYLKAREEAPAIEIRTLPTNWRSDAPLVAGLQVLLRGAALGHRDIVVHPVGAHHQDSRLVGAPHPEPFRLRFLPVPDKPVTGYVARQQIARDLAADIARLLGSGARYVEDDGNTRDLVASDIAIITRSMGYGVAEVFAKELRRFGIASVHRGGDSVLSTPASDEWLRLLEAIERPQQSRRVRAAALTNPMGYHPDQLITGADQFTDERAEELRRWQDLLRHRGIAGVHEALSAQGLAARILSQPEGERLLTDITHLAQILHEAWQTQRLGLVGLLQWFRHERETAAKHGERTRRLDTDRHAVQLLTVHASKGLQFPIVYLPSAFHNKVDFDDTIHLFHDPVTHLRQLDVTGLKEHPLAKAENAGENLRLDYVALTRARSQVVAYYARTDLSGNGGLTRLMLGRTPEQADVPDAITVPSKDGPVLDHLRKWEQIGAFTLEQATGTISSEPALAAAAAPSMQLRRWERTLDTEWRRTSYSGLIRAEEQVVVSEADDTATDDEETLAAEALEEPTTAPDVDDLPSPMNDLPAGAAFGSLVHAVLEHVDPQAEDLRQEIRRHVAEQQRWWAIDADEEALTDGLLPMQLTPMGPLVDDLRLIDIGRRDRLCELDFEIPLVGGDEPRSGAVQLRRVGDLIREHLPADDPMRAYADKLDNPSLGDQILRGYLSGSIDVVLRVGARYVVVDYKTNRLGEPGQPVTALDYTQQRMTDAMLHSHYPLQALLYSVVLHRYLRWRQPDYDPATHLGGVLYLYVRGMCGPETPVVDGVPCGAFSWQPPVSLIEALSDLLAGMEVAR